MRKTFKRFFLALVLAVGAGTAWAEELTVNDGTATNAYIPIYGSYVDKKGTTSEFIIPSGTLEEIDGATLSKMSFYVSSAASWEPKFKVYIKEVEQTVYASYGGSIIGDADATTVYEGVLTPKTAGGTMDINFTKDYVYGGGNLLVGLEVTETASYASCGFYGISTSTTYRSYNSKQGAQGFLPKVTFTYTPAAGVLSKPKNVAASNITSSTATITWTAGGSETAWEISYGKTNAAPDEEGSYPQVSTASYDLTELDANTTYYVFVRGVDGDTKSKWTAACSFTTACGTVVIDADHSFSEDFSDNALPTCWEVNNENKSGGSGWTVNSDGFAYSGYYGDTYLIMPEMKVEGNVVLTFDSYFNYASSYPTNGSSVVISTNGTAASDFTTTLYTFTKAELPSSSSTALPKEISLASYSGQTIYVAFKYVGSNAHAWYVDNISVKCEAVVAKMSVEAEAAYAFGFVSSKSAASATSKTFKVTNVGYAPLTDANVAYTGDAAISVTPAGTLSSIAVSESADITIAVNTETPGTYSGTITVTGTGSDDVVIPVTATVLDPNKLYVDFNDGIPTGWTANGWTTTAGTPGYASSKQQYSTTPNNYTKLISSKIQVTEGETLSFDVAKYNSSSYYGAYLKVYYSTDAMEWTEAKDFSSSCVYGSWTRVSIEAGSGEGQIPTTAKYIAFEGSNVYLAEIYGFALAAEPDLVYAPADYQFGMIAESANSTSYTIKNVGGGDLTNLKVASDNEAFTISELPTTIAAQGEATFTVTMNTTKVGQQNGNITLTADGYAEGITFAVSGYAADGDQIFTTFAALPDRWTNSGWSFSEANGAATSSSSSKLETPKIKIIEGQKLAISAKLQYSGSYYVTVKGSTDNGTTWSYEKKLSNDVLNNTAYSVVEIDDIPATVNKLQLVGNYVYVNGFNGFNYDDDDPQFAMYSNEACTTAITAATATNAWGFLAEDKTATYYVKNDGTGTLNVAIGAIPTGFTAELGKATLAAGESTSLTIAMKNDATDNEGYHAGDVVLTATDSESNVLGTFTVTSSGVVVSSSKSDINFASLTDFPAGWEATNWSVSGGKATTNSYSNGTLTTGTFKVAEGESLVIEAKGNYQYSAPTLTYQYSKDGGENWTTGTSTLCFTYSSDYQVQAITDIAAADEVIIKFTGKYIDIDRLYGYTVVAKPVMALDKTADYDFGMQTADAEYVITVTNSGTAVLNNLSASVTTTDYEAKVSATTVGIGESATITVTQKFDASKGLATLSDVLTISADDVQSKTINLKGQTRDADKWYVDFATAIPSDFVEKGSWTVSSGAAYTTSSAETSLVSKPITLAAGEKVQFEARNPYGGSLSVRYSVNGGLSWSEYTDYSSAISTGSTFSSHVLDLQNTESVTAIVEFKGRYYVYLDNIYGGMLAAEAPMVSVKKNGTAVESGATENFGSIFEEATATYTLSNVGTGTLTLTEPATTGDATATLSATSLTAGQSATLTITMPVSAEKGYGAKEGTVTVSTSLGDFVVNYTATTMNPNALSIDFADNAKPTGWYFGGYWTVESQEATIQSSTAADLITQKLTVAGETDAITFQAARNSDRNNPSFKVYTSQDRVEWTEVDLSDVTLSTTYQDITVKGLAAGDYYLKITGSRVKVDNFIGWTKANVTRDLYVTAATFPTATQQAGATISASATVISLIADEEGVYAKLFLDGQEVKQMTTDEEDNEVEADNKVDIALNGTKTFSFTATLPTAPGTYKALVKVYFSDGTEAFATAENDVKVYYTLDETVDPETIVAGTYDVILNRTFVAGWNTVCLPFDTPVSKFNGTTEDAVAYQLTKYDDVNKELTFTKVTTLEAGKPYVIYTPTAITDALTFTNCEMKAGEAGNDTYGAVAFQGTYKSVNFAADGCFGLTAEGKIVKIAAGATLKGFRGYFTGIPAGARVAFRGGDIATGISTITVDRAAVEGAYNLRGQKVERLNKGGLYIVNGKKVVVK